MKRTTVLLIIVTIISKLLGFGREISLSYFYGATNISDAYMISLTVPGVIFTFIGVGLGTSFIPIYSMILKEECQEYADKFTNNTVNFTLLLSTVIVVICSLLTVPSVKLFAPGFSGETLDIAVAFTRISIFGVYFTGLIYIFSAYLNLNKKFIITALIGIPFNLLIIFSIAISTKLNVLLLSIGSVIAIALQLIILLPFVYKEGYRYKFMLVWNDKYLRKMLYLSSPVIIGVSVNQINVLVNTMIASKIVSGGISVLNYANKLNDFVQGVFVLSIVTVMYPMIAKSATEMNTTELKHSVSESMTFIHILVLPTAVWVAFFSEPIIKLLFGRGAFNNEAILMTSSAMLFYSLGMSAIGLREVLVRTFYALQDTKTPMINAAIALCINIVLSINLSRILGISGLALAASLSAIVCMVLLIYNLRCKIGPFGMKRTIISAVKILSISLIMGIVDRIIYFELLKKYGECLCLVFSIGIGGVLYITMIRLVGIKEIDDVFALVKVKVRTMKEVCTEFRR